MKTGRLWLRGTCCHVTLAHRTRIQYRCFVLANVNHFSMHGAFLVELFRPQNLPERGTCAEIGCDHLSQCTVNVCSLQGGQIRRQTQFLLAN